MKREMLKELGLTDEQIDKIMAENGSDIEKHKAAAETTKAELEGIKAQLTERDRQLKELQGSAGDNAALKEQLATLETANKEQKTAFEKQMQDLRFKTALERELLKAEVVDADLVGVKLDKNKLKLNDDGTLAGLSEQLDGLKSNFGFLFKQSQTTTITGAEPASKTKPVDKPVEQMTYSEMMAYMAANPDAKI